MRDSTALLDGQRKEIYQAEKEAEELEQMEAQLLQALQKT